MLRSSIVSMSLLLLAGGAFAGAQTRTEVSIEATLNRDLDSKDGWTTLGMVEAYDKAVKAYAAEIGRIYRKLEHELPPNQRAALIRGQLAWQEYLKAQRLMVSYVYDADGTVHKPMAMALLKDVLRHRLEELCEWFMRQQGEHDETTPGVEAWCKESHEDMGGVDVLAAAAQAAKPLPGGSKRP